MTECGPIICYEDWLRYKPGSCGKAAPRMEIKIDSPDPQNIVGEILTRGENVMLGYYKNPEATAQAIDAEGWLHTGDLGVIDKNGNVTIKGRSKNMLLGPSGQNIYPEEIEEKISNLPYVCENIVIQQSDHKLAALIYPDFEEAYKQGLTDAILKESWKKTAWQQMRNFLLILRLRASRFIRKNLKRHLRRASSASYTKKSSSK